MSADIARLAHAAVERGEGILRLAPTWVPRAFLHPGRRLKLAAEDLYTLGADRGGIDERWLSSTIAADNPGAPADEGLSYVVSEGDRITLRDAVAAVGAEIVGKEIWDRYRRWPVFAKLFDNMGMIPLHLHQDDALAALVGRQGKPEAYYFPPQLNRTQNAFPYTFFGLDPATTRSDVRRCLERWDRGENGILDLSRASRLKPGTGWLVGPRILHAPGSLVTFEPQWASDVFAIYQSRLEDRPIPWDLLVKDVPPDHRHDLDFLVDLLDWEANTDPHFKERHFLGPRAVADTASEGFIDRWVVYGDINGRQLFSARELTVNPGATACIRDSGAFGLIVTQGRGRIDRFELDCPTQIRFGQLTDDEVFVCADRARQGVVFENQSRDEPLVTLRYFGPDACPDMPTLDDPMKR